MTARKTKAHVGTDIIVILDKSGSMASVWDDTIGGFNSWLEKQKTAGPDQTLTLTLFDTTCQTPYVEKPLADVAPLTRVTYVPGGNTALLDAIGATVKKIQDKDQKNAILVVIITDGEENSSHEYTRAAIKALVEDRQAAGWQFLYIGADQSGFADAQTMGYGGTRSYGSTHVGTQTAYAGLSQATMAYSRAGIRGQSIDSLVPDLTEPTTTSTVKP
jgi:uncharacterized protein YegL